MFAVGLKSVIKTGYWSSPDTTSSAVVHERPSVKSKMKAASARCQELLVDNIFIS